MSKAKQIPAVTGGMISSALVASLIGYGSTIALLLAAAQAVGATAAQAQSWICAICLAKAVGSAWLSWRWRVPAVLAWSTPGAALIAASSGVNFAEAVGAFVVAGGLIALTGLIRPLGRAVTLIPDAIAGAMLAGVLLPFCLGLTPALNAAPVIVLPMVVVFVLVRLWNASYAVLCALLVGLGMAWAGTEGAFPWPALALPRLEFTLPEFTPGVVIGLALPLYLVTMASQNLPGFATLRAHSFEPPVESALRTTGGISMLAGLLGAHTISMAAITAALCMGPEVHPERSQRWRVGLVYAGFWLLLALLGPLLLGVLTALPAEVMPALVGLALIAPITGALSTAWAKPESRFNAAVTLVVTASGVGFFGVGAAFWGLLAGLVLETLDRLVKGRV